MELAAEYVLAAGLLIMTAVIVYKLPKAIRFLWKKYRSPYRCMSIKNYRQTMKKLAGGLAGEKRTYDILNECGKGYNIYQNLFIPTKSGYTELDMVLVHKKAIVVIENKNWNGRIYGGEYEKLWYAYPNNPEKKPVSHYNPVSQNEKHCLALQKYLGNELAMEDEIESLIVFNNSDISKLDIKSRKSYVTTDAMLLHDLKYILKHNRGSFKKRTLKRIEAKLKVCTDDKSQKLKAEHIRNIYGNGGYKSRAHKR